ncbi:MAG: hypothetical protein O3A46_00790 [Candidatus Poribacteria bacterium]|nr:hypothetical protein [Candidatus Poribacteria bacterium]
MHDIDEAKRAIKEQLERGGRVPKERVYHGHGMPGSLIKGALARLESEEEIRVHVHQSSGREYYELIKKSPMQKILGLFSK